jgi:hypothetical protein
MDDLMLQTGRRYAAQKTIMDDLMLQTGRRYAAQKR